MQTPNEQKQSVSNKTTVVYGLVSCSVPANANVYESRGKKSTVCIQVAVPILAAGLTVDAAVWARLQQKNGDDEITFEAAIPRGIKASDELSSESFKAHVESAVTAWNGYAAAEAAAIRRLTGQKAKSAIERPGLAPRLVKRVSAAAPAA